MTADLSTELVPVDQLTTHPRNPRTGNVQAIAESLSVNGQYRPIVVSSDWVILAGNHTYLAARQLGWDRIAAVQLPWDSQSPEAARVMVADNRTADLGSYDSAAMLALLDDLLEAGDTALAGTGYGEDDREVLLRLVSYESLGKVDPSAEWVDMPEFSAENLPQGAYRATFRFETMADADSFFAMIGRDKRTVVFWPEDWDPDQRQFSGEGKPRVVSDA